MNKYEYRCYHCGHISDLNENCSKCGGEVYNLTEDNIRRSKVKYIDNSIESCYKIIVLLKEEKSKLL